MTGRAERRALVALFAIFALLAQAFLPAAAMAAAQGPTGVICVAHGVQSAAAGHAPDKGAPMRGCEHCACPAAFTAAPPVSAAAAETIAFAPASPVQLAERPAPGRGLAAPPPPSQGPPNFRS